MKLSDFGRRIPETVQCPILLRPSSMHLLVPELRQQHAPARVHEAARISGNGRVVVAAYGAVDGA